MKILLCTNLKASINLFSVILLVLLFLSISASIIAQIPSDSIYFGQSPPADSAVIFAPGKISLKDRFERTPNFYPDSTEFYFTVITPDYGNQDIYVTKYQNDSWTDPSKSYLLGSYAADLSITEDGLKMCFTSNRGNSDFWNTDIWVTERNDTGWSEPARFPAIINSTASSGEWGGCLLNNGNLYFCRGINNGDIFLSNFTEEEYSGPVALSKLNTSYAEWDPFVPEDESYIIFKSNRPGGFGNLDLYISYKLGNGEWTEPKNLGSKINSSLHDDCGNLTPDGKYFIFARRDGNIEMDLYWVSASFIENLKPKNLNPYLGQSFPGDVPEKFATDILSKPGRKERVLTFTPEGDEIFFSVILSDNFYSIYTFKQKEGVWQEEQEASFIGDYMTGKSCIEPFVSPDGSKLFFTAKENSSSGDWNYDIWVTERSDTTWGEPEKLNSNVNTGSGEWHPCVTNSGNLYFARNGNIYFSEFSGETYSAAIKISTVCSSANDWDPYVDPDEQFMIFKSDRSGGFGQMDNYISFRNELNTDWMIPINLGENLNTELKDDAGDVSPDGKYMFYSRTESNGEMDVYWVSTSFIEDLHNSVPSINQTIRDDVIIYPNPATDLLNLNYHPNCNAIINFRMIDINGKILLQGKTSDNMINISELPNGLYFLNFCFENTLVNTKVLIRR